jgi:hypothetical protein
LTGPHLVYSVALPIGLRSGRSVTGWPLPCHVDPEDDPVVDLGCRSLPDGWGFVVACPVDLDLVVYGGVCSAWPFGAAWCLLCLSGSPLGTVVTVML